MANINLSKTQFSKMIQLGGFFADIITSLGQSLVKAGLEGLRELGKDTTKDTIKRVKENATLLTKNAAVY